MTRTIFIILFLLLSLPVQAARPDSDARQLVTKYLGNIIAFHPYTYPETKPYLRYYTKETSDLLQKNIDKKNADCPVILVLLTDKEPTHSFRITSESTKDDTITIKGKLAYIFTEKSSFKIHQRDIKFLLKKENTRWRIEDYYDADWPDGLSFRDLLHYSLENECGLLDIYKPHGK